MADNMAVTPGVGATVAADEIAGVLHQRVKMSLGADGTANDAVAGAGVVGPGVQRMTLASDDPAVAALLAAIPAGANLIGKVNVQGNPGTLTDKSGTITLGGTAQPAIALNAARNGYMIQNQSSGNLYFSTLATAIVGQPSLLLAPGQTYETPLNGFGTGAVSVIGATTGQAFAAREW